MDIPLSHANERVRNVQLVRSGLTILFLIILNGAFRTADWFLRDFQGPVTFRLGVLLLPWLVMLASIPIYRRYWRKDELETLINYRAISFAFYGLMIGVVVMGQLQSAGFLLGFKWTDGILMMAMMVLLLAGIGWSKLRYR